MTDIHQAHTALGDVAARTLANATKTVPMMGTITPLANPYAAMGAGRGGYLSC